MADKTQILSRDPFARTTEFKRTVTTTKTCSWCGQKRKNGKLYEYGNESNSGRTTMYSGKFCSKSCFNSYNER